MQILLTGKSAKIIEKRRIFSSDPKPKEVAKYHPPERRTTKPEVIPSDQFETLKIRVFIKTKVPRFTKLPNKEEILNQSIQKSFENEEELSQMKQQSFKFFKNKASEEKNAYRKRNKLPLSLTEINDTNASFLRKSYFSNSLVKSIDKSLGFKSISNPKI